MLALCTERKLQCCTGGARYTGFFHLAGDKISAGPSERLHRIDFAVIDCCKGGEIPTTAEGDLIGGRNAGRLCAAQQSAGVAR